MYRMHSMMGALTHMESMVCSVIVLVQTMLVQCRCLDQFGDAKLADHHSSCICIVVAHHENVPERMAAAHS